MKKLMFILVAAMFLFAACEKKENSVEPVVQESGFFKDAPADACAVTKMIAGGGKYDENCTGEWVGNIYVSDDGTDVTVIYEIIEQGWMIDATHLYVGLEEDIPANKAGNPKIGKFPYSMDHGNGVVTYTYVVNNPDRPYVVSAHADVSGNYGATEDFCASLPETATIMVQTNLPISYMKIHVSEAEWLDGIYEGWCVDQAEGILANHVYELSDVYCIYEDLTGIIHDPANMDLVNWIVNQEFVGEPSGCDGLYTVMDVQEAIWYLVDDVFETDPTCKTLEIIAMAQANGEDYVPDCGDYTIVVFDPGTGVQKVIIRVPLVCGSETAWGYGYNGTYCDPNGAMGTSFTDAPLYGGNAWGWYFYGCSSN